MPAGKPRGHRPVICVVGAKRRVSILLKLADQAMAGDTASAKLLLERMDPTLARQELTGRDGAAIQIEKPDLGKLTDAQLDALIELNGESALGEAKPNGSGNGQLPH